MCTSNGGDNESGTTCSVSKTFVLKPRPESDLDCLIVSTFAPHNLNAARKRRRTRCRCVPRTVAGPAATPITGMAPPTRIIQSPLCDRSTGTRQPPLHHSALCPECSKHGEFIVPGAALRDTWASGLKQMPCTLQGYLAHKKQRHPRTLQ